MNECICGKIISSNKLYCRTCHEEVILSLQQVSASIDRSEE
jgi:hypothetical protein